MMPTDLHAYYRLCNNIQRCHAGVHSASKLCMIHVRTAGHCSQLPLGVCRIAVEQLECVPWV